MSKKLEFKIILLRATKIAINQIRWSANRSGRLLKLEHLTIHICCISRMQVSSVVLKIPKSKVCSSSKSSYKLKTVPKNCHSHFLKIVSSLLWDGIHSALTVQPLCKLNIRSMNYVPCTHFRDQSRIHELEWSGTTFAIKRTVEVKIAAFWVEKFEKEVMAVFRKGTER